MEGGLAPALRLETPLIFGYVKHNRKLICVKNASNRDIGLLVKQ
jgi:hypothetical protein